ncbi:type II CAAX endopeptidase family protein [Streptomyces liangshanensis]|uniref:CPBP family intramembrane metalloprotease n=1 Tax=Streptomyces liangshanensis TaxID=2717324 RepID=A0A6G9H031_9ACTN|nr:type II CAAX endopeptidase family protein [Streptomyces liangshanensis]QIQ03893.1 CPBP family intramembrane metalloprotease [Streptomyces liangshanensis]
MFEQKSGSGLRLFFTVTFATTWAFWLTAIALGGSATSSPTAVPYLLGGFGPVFGALAVRARRARRRGPVPARAVPFRQGVRTFLALPLLVLASATVVGGALLANLLGGPGVNLTEGRELIATMGGAVPFFVSMLIAGPLAEEPGWRGTAYPRLRASMGRVGAGGLLGAVWAVWHLPLFFIEGTVQAELGLFSWSGLMFSLSVVPVALLTGYAYERAGVVASVAVHLGFNATMAVLTVESPVTQAGVLGVQIVVATVLLATSRERGADRSVRASRSDEVQVNRSVGAGLPDARPDRAAAGAPYGDSRTRG